MLQVGHKLHVQMEPMLVVHEVKQKNSVFVVELIIVFEQQEELNYVVRLPISYNNPTTYEIIYPYLIYQSVA